MSNTTTFDNFYSSQAYGDIRREYYAEIADIVRECIEENTPAPDDDGTVYGPDADACRDWLHETIDGHSWVIYTAKAVLVALVSDADGDEYLSDMGMEHPTVEQRAYACMMQEAEEELSDRLAEIEEAQS